MAISTYTPLFRMGSRRASASLPRRKTDPKRITELRAAIAAGTYHVPTPWLVESILKSAGL